MSGILRKLKSNTYVFNDAEVRLLSGESFLSNLLEVSFK